MCEVEIVRSGFKPFGDVFDGGIAWLVLEPTDASDEDILDAVDMYPSYRGPGQPFCKEAYIKRSTSRILVTQMQGMDC